ncbi:hypothetical protein ACQKM1_26375 [Peribacillus frigoritolerans]|uniref:hypothetical protein n=1 Tax=Peribacillus frigoritolerans TaxID=450367 RepID=UPI003D078788
MTIRNVWQFISTGGKKDTQGGRAEEHPAKPVEAPQAMIDIRNNKKKYFPESKIVIIYLLGNYIGSNEDPASKTTGRTYLDNSVDPCHLITITEAADAYLLAHELGHVFNYSRVDNNMDDADPISTDRAHNRNVGNIMYPEAGTVLTTEQCEKFFRSPIINQ